MREVIDSCRENYALPESPMARWVARLTGKRSYLVDCWLDGVPLSFIRHYATLLVHGRVVWGHIAQANNAIFQPGYLDMPADVVYSTDTYFNDNLEHLADIACSVYRLKNTRPEHPALAHIAEIMTDEFSQEFHEPLPPLLTDGKNVFMGYLQINRRRLPTGYLTMPFFPLVICPEKTPVTMVLPLRYWPAEFVEHWKEFAEENPVEPLSDTPDRLEMTRSEILAAYREAPLAVTPQAATYIAHVARQRNLGNAFFLRVGGKFDQGRVNYRVEIGVGEPEDHEIVEESSGYRFYIDMQSLRFLIAKKIVFTQGLVGIGLCIADNDG